MKERAIKKAFDKKANIVIDADEVFRKTKEAFDKRRKYNEKEIEPYCLECKERLFVSSSKYDRLHFKHFQNTDCFLRTGNLTIEEREIFYNILIGKESQRHYQLKNSIAEKLLKLESVDKETLTIDSKFIIRGDEKRKPDVYCKYTRNNKVYELVFEIQLSKLSLKYILNRYNFYKKNGMYLIWILDNFDIHNQSQFERDIKYLTDFQNYFKLDETTDEFRLLCDYKYPYISYKNRVEQKWFNKSVAIEQINFSEENYQIYYYNYGEEYIKRQEDLLIRENEIKKEEEEQRQIERTKDIKNLVETITNQIKVLKTNKEILSELKQNIEDGEQTYSDDFIQALNNRLKIRTHIDKTTSKPFINWLIFKAKEFDRDSLPPDLEYVHFFLDCEILDIEVNKQDNGGVTVLQEIWSKYENLSYHSDILIHSLFKRNYKLQASDIEIIKSQYYDNKRSREGKIIQLKSYDRLKNKSLLENIDKYLTQICIIESAKQNQIVGFNYQPTEWIAFVNNAIQFHTSFWSYFELAFRKYGLFDNLIAFDKKNTFQSKLQNYYNNLHEFEQDYLCDDVINDLYPEIFENN